MSTVSAHDIARELRARVPNAGDVQTQKWCYYAQGWHLAWTGNALFREPIEAWELGPVVADMWHDEKQGRPKPPPMDLDDDALVTVGFVVSRYGKLSGRELITLTHDEGPWRNATDNGLKLNAEITHDELRIWFESDPDQLELRSLGRDIARQSDLRRAVGAVSRPRTTPVADETEELAALLERL